jgi:uncharacterized membrane protein
MAKAMTIKQRIFQAILFETIALLLSYGLIKLFGQATATTPHNTQTNDGAVWLMLIGISLIAMIWTFIYNLIFDKLFPGEKLSRPLWLRALHIIGFEGGLLCLTLPLVMWVLQIGFWQALLMDISLSLLILVYGFIFYWVYDWLWAKLYDKA